MNQEQRLATGITVLMLFEASSQAIVGNQFQRILAARRTRYLSFDWY